MTTFASLSSFAFVLLFYKTIAFPSDSISFAVDIQGCSASWNAKNYRPTAQDVQRYVPYWTGSQLYSVAWAMDVCTYGNPQYTLPASNHPVFPTPVSMPCAGTTAISKSPYNFETTCGYFELYAVQEASQKAYELNSGTTLTARRRIVINVPMTCQFYGSGSQDCNGPYCYTWIRSDRSFFWMPGGAGDAVMSTVMHELGHTLSLQHSANWPGLFGATYWQYGDCSCIMGCASNAGTCFNAPVARQLGYVSPIADLDDANMPLNSWVNYNLPVFSMTSVNHITLRSVGMNNIIVFLSVRSSDANPNGADSKISRNYDKVLSIHMTQKHDTSDYNKPMIIAVVAIGSTYVLEPGQDITEYESLGKISNPFNGMLSTISIKLISLSNANGAVVSICRYKTTEAACRTSEGYVDAPLNDKQRDNDVVAFNAFNANEFDSISYRRQFLKGGSEL